MVGRLEIQRLRAEAERALDDRFDIRSFHDAVLGNGDLPLTVLADVIHAWNAQPPSPAPPLPPAPRASAPGPGQGAG